MDPRIERILAGLKQPRGAFARVWEEATALGLTLNSDAFSDYLDRRLIGPPRRVVAVCARLWPRTVGARGSTRLASGSEGAMTFDLDSEYVCGRRSWSAAWRRESADRLGESDLWQLAGSRDLELRFLVASTPVLARELLASQAEGHPDLQQSALVRATPHAGRRMEGGAA